MAFLPKTRRPGYDVSGDEAGTGCPHKPGTCLVNEEFSLGKCCWDAAEDQMQIWGVPLDNGVGMITIMVNNGKD